MEKYSVVFNCMVEVEVNAKSPDEAVESADCMATEVLSHVGNAHPLITMTRCEGHPHVMKVEK